MHPSGEYLIDNDVLAYALAGEGGYEDVVRWWKTLSRGQRVLACSTFEEMRFGHALLVEGERYRRAEEIDLVIEEALSQTHLLMYSREVVAEYARLRAKPQLKNLWITRPEAGRPASGGDVWLAAFSRVFDLPIASANEAHFKLIHEEAALPGAYNPVKRTWFIVPRAFDETDIKLVPGRSVRGS